MYVDRFKSVVNKRGGLAPANRFAVYMPLPLISFDPQKLIAKAFGKGNSAAGGLKSFFNDPRDISMLCDSVTLPGRQISTNEVYNNMLGVKMPYNYINDEVSMTFHVTNDHFMKEFFDNWVDRIFDRGTMTMSYKSDYAVDILIEQLDQKDIPVYACSLKNAFPVSVTSYEISNASDNTFQKVTVNFAYEDWSKEGFLQSAITKGKILVGSVGQTFGF